MGRPRGFDEDAVLDAAMRRFWAHGYDATSVRDLADAMGITGASLYIAFGDKQALYRRALDRYLRHGIHDRIARLSALPPAAALRAFFAEIVDHSVNDPERCGCLLVNAGLETAPRDPALRRQVAGEFAAIETFFESRIAAGQADGTLRRDLPAGNGARMLLSVLLDLRVLARTRPHRTVLDGAVGTALALLDGASA